MLAPFRRDELALAAEPGGPVVALLTGIVGSCVARAEQRECAQHHPPQTDQQADLHLLLGVPDDDQIDSDATQSNSAEHAQCAESTSLVRARSKGGHAVSLAIGGRCSVSPLSLFVVS